MHRARSDDGAEGHQGRRRELRRLSTRRSGDLRHRDPQARHHDNRDLWKWFSHVNERGKYAFRLDVKIRVAGPAEELPGNALTIQLFRALPVKFKFGDLNARATEVGIEELHLAHEGLTI